MERTTTEIVRELNRVWHEEHDELDVLLDAANRLVEYEDLLRRLGQLQVVVSVPPIPLNQGHPVNRGWWDRRRRAKSA